MSVFNPAPEVPGGVPSTSGLPPALVALHWTIAALIFLALGSLLLRSAMPSGNALRPWLRSVHLISGQLVFLLALARVWVRLRAKLSPTPGVPAWARVAGHGAHMTLYVVMLAQPALGVAFMQAGGKAVTLFGWTLPTLVAEDTHLHFDLKALHHNIGYALYGLLLLHVAAALWHHHVLKNDTLLRMLNRRKAPAPTPTADAWPQPLPEPTPQALAAQALQAAARPGQPAPAQPAATPASTVAGAPAPAVPARPADHVD